MYSNFYLLLYIYIRVRSEINLATKTLRVICRNSVLWVISFRPIQTWSVWVFNDHLHISW